MKVWVDQDLCVGNGICEELCPEVFAVLDGGIAYVRADGRVLMNPGGPGSVAAVPTGFEESVVEAAEECPAECIFVEAD